MYDYANEVQYILLILLMYSRSKLSSGIVNIRCWLLAWKQRVLNVYREQGFLALFWFGPSPSSPSPISKLDRKHTGRLSKRDNLLTGEGWGAESYDREKAWSSINQSLLSAWGGRLYIHINESIFSLILMWRLTFCCKSVYKRAHKIIGILL